MLLVPGEAAKVQAFGSTADEDGVETGSTVEEPDDVGTGNEDEQDMGEDLEASSEEAEEITEDLPPGETWYVNKIRICAGSEIDNIQMIEI